MATSATERVMLATPLAVLPTAPATSPVIVQAEEATWPVVLIVVVARLIGALTAEQADKARAASALSTCRKGRMVLRAFRGVGAMSMRRLWLLAHFLLQIRSVFAISRGAFISRVHG